jgi:hypothetical protein
LMVQAGRCEVEVPEGRTSDQPVVSHFSLRNCGRDHPTGLLRAIMVPPVDLGTSAFADRGAPDCDRHCTHGSRRGGHHRPAGHPPASTACQTCRIG